MDKLPVIIIVVVVALAALLFFIFAPQPSQVVPTPLPSGIVLFFGDGCPHCKDVEDYVSANNIEQKVKFTREEVWYNKNNAALLGQVAQMCKISTNTVGVPFLYDGKNCLVGEVDIINFFKNEAGIK